METGEGLVDIPARSRTVSLYNRFDEGRAVVYGFKLGLLSAQLVDRAGFEGHVAQLVRAPASHAGGPQFESGRAHHLSPIFSTIPAPCGLNRAGQDRQNLQEP